jgi:hypothetical protein
MGEFAHNAPLAFIIIVVKRVVGLTLQFEPGSKSSSKQILTRVVAENSTPTPIYYNKMFASPIMDFKQLCNNGMRIEDTIDSG